MSKGKFIAQKTKGEDLMMILSGKKLKEALSEGSAGLEKKKKLPRPVYTCRFDTEKSLFHDKKDEQPLFTCRLKGDFKLPLIEFFVALAAGFAALSLFGHCMKKKFSKKK